MRTYWNNLSLMHRRGYAYATLITTIVALIAYGIELAMGIDGSIDWPPTIVLTAAFSMAVFVIVKVGHWLGKTEDSAQASNARQSDQDTNSGDTNVVELHSVG